MQYIFIGLAGFSLIHLADLAEIKKIPLLKSLAWLCGCIVLVLAVFGIIGGSPRLIWYNWVTATGLIILSVSLLVLVYALFLNLPFKDTYISSGSSRQVIKTGLYACVRHPGLYPFAGVMTGLVLAFPSYNMLLAALIWIIADLILIIVQDRLVFPRMFPDYDQYKKEIPMIIPRVECLFKISRVRKEGINKTG